MIFFICLLVQVLFIQTHSTKPKSICVKKSKEIVGILFSVGHHFWCVYTNLENLCGSHSKCNKCSTQIVFLSIIIGWKYKSLLKTTSLACAIIESIISIRYHSCIWLSDYLIIIFPTFNKIMILPHTCVNFEFLMLYEKISNGNK